MTEATMQPLTDLVIKAATVLGGMRAYQRACIDRASTPEYQPSLKLVYKIWHGEPIRVTDQLLRAVAEGARQAEIGASLDDVVRAADVQYPRQRGGDDDAIYGDPFPELHGPGVRVVVRYSPNDSEEDRALTRAMIERTLADIARMKAEAREAREKPEPNSP
ncbi:hypothetical protein [Yinghuangia sp. YIM S09857]|uniref:hypothetical protein n=1 Tax=Yinghuangia sp. YIM S09857 TaxID=3436929 RepID=UPI003F52DCBA